MRVVAWNCQGAFHKKLPHTTAVNPDILIIPESEYTKNVPLELEGRIPNSVIWHGNTPRKGLMILAYGDYHIKLHPNFVSEYKWVIPIIVSGPISFLLLAVWTLPNKETGSYVQPLFQALESYKGLFDDFPVMWAGDFNSNFIFDLPRRKYRFCDFVNLLKERDIVSLYHAQTNTQNGDEADKTFFLYRHKDKGYHIDYFFACPQIRKLGFHITIGFAEEWLDKSDHMPIICDILSVEPNK